MRRDTTSLSYSWGDAPEFLGTYHVLFSLSQAFLSGFFHADGSKTQEDNLQGFIIK